MARKKKKFDIEEKFSSLEESEMRAILPNPFLMGQQGPTEAEILANPDLDLRNFPSIRLPVHQVEVHPEPGLNSNALNAFRRRVIARITELLPTGFSLPSRNVGDNKTFWETNTLILTYWPGGTLEMACKRVEGATIIREVARKVFNPLAEEYDVTQYDETVHGDMPFIPYPEE